jgi:excisionase family DNA binding protein
MTHGTMDDSHDSIIEQLHHIREATLLLAKDIYTSDEAALFLGVKRSYLYELVRRRAVPYYKSRGGKLTYFRRSDLEAWMTHNKFTSTDTDD